jgi:hypothetical protein
LIIDILDYEKNESHTADLVCPAIDDDGRTNECHV